ncbi:MAG: DUF6345 domain-containing protein [Trueperaceae bacterium]|nr:DUF6345 domain-containing protein [Trueperaceae bacterium]
MNHNRLRWGLLALVIFAVSSCATDTTPPPEPPGERGDELPVYRVVAPGADAEQAAALAEALGLDREKLSVENNVIIFFDPARFASIPTLDRGEGRNDEDEGAVVLEAIDFEALEKIEVPDSERAEAQFLDAFEKAELDRFIPGGMFTPTRQRTVFEAQDVAGRPVASVAIDTRIGLGFALTQDEVPLIGPGAVAYANFDSEGVTSLRIALRGLEPGDVVPVISPEEAAENCRRAFAGSGFDNVRVSTRTVYYTPPLELASARVIVPHTECSGVARVGDEEVSLLQQLLPAVQASEFVPAARISAEVRGSEVRANIRVEGGRAPYTVTWSSVNVSLSEPTKSPGDTLSYRVVAREKVEQETLIASVTDANGVTVQVSRTFAVESETVSETVFELRPQVGGVSDFGTENAVTNEFGGLDQGFIDEMRADGITERFSWGGLSAWERDFKSPNDNSYIDNTDITFYVGHGFGGGFTFENKNRDDGTLYYTDADDTWGDNDLEWLALYSCQVLRADWSGLSHFDRWKGEFDGLHLLLGFDTNAYVYQNFSREFARNLVDRNLTVRTAWFKAVDDIQPEGVVARVMGVYGDGVSSYNDHFWGRGSVSPDLRGEAISGYWSVSRVVD